ncbi:MAG: tetratricopeptide repeat protein [Prevotellaceae bacterium]|jgi:TPR repeat protein|nr:tetratricopeptide repeat protein [Prevotellaceae bacterium]
MNIAEALNNLGVAYYNNKQYTKAKEYFDRAASAGSKIAQRNSAELTRWLNTQP